MIAPGSEMTCPGMILAIELDSWSERLPMPGQGARVNGGRSSEQKHTEKVANKMDTVTRNMMGPSRRLPRGNICCQVAEWSGVSEMLPSLSFW